ncbi:hypothetical protein C2E23DRAFT_860323 [Lenzites betulinus]|nr:hypothetical protein C2E23DRAFT_860323 [Lenzites betulinus]
MHMSAAQLPTKHDGPPPLFASGGTKRTIPREFDNTGGGPNKRPTGTVDPSNVHVEPALSGPEEGFKRTGPDCKQDEHAAATTSKDTQQAASNEEVLSDTETAYGDSSPLPDPAAHLSAAFTTYMQGVRIGVDISNARIARGRLAVEALPVFLKLAADRDEDRKAQGLPTMFSLEEALDYKNFIASCIFCPDGITPETFEPQSRESSS